MADDKPEVPAPKAAPENAAPAAPERPAPEPSLGKVIAAARERRGFSQSSVAKDAHIPPYYVRMIENDDYTLISDQLYLLPFLRKYATFVGLDPEEVASRFIRDVQRADVSAARMSEPIPMAGRRRKRPWLRVALIAIAVIAALGIADLGYRFFQSRGSRSPEPSPAPSAAASPASAPVAAPAVPAVAVEPAASATRAAPAASGATPRSGEHTRSAVPRPALP